MSNFSTSIDNNPLLKGLPCNITQEEWWERLDNDPFAGEDLLALPPFQRDLLLDRFCELYVPTQKAAEVAHQIHRMLIGGLIDRDPCSPEQKRRLHQLAANAQRGVLDVPWVNATSRGMRLSGITKQGKTRLLKRILSQYPQTLVRPQNNEAGWIHLVQLVYLVIPMPTDATKGGFLMSAFIELDKALGTNYANETQIKNATIDAQLVQFLAKLAIHRCGLLVIEEAQESNELAKTRFGSDFGTFFLRVLNTGIPTIIVGNPLAFHDLSTSSQLMSRLSDPGLHELTPASSATVPEWGEDLVPGIWGRTLLPEVDEHIPDLPQKLYDWTGGFKHFLSVLRRESMRAAMARDGRYVTGEDIDEANRTSVMVEGRKIFQSYWIGRLGGETNFTDIPGLPSAAVDAARPRRRQRRR